MEINAPRGTSDVLPEDVGLWQYAEGIVRQTFEKYGYREIRTPIFEHTELFERGVGQTTDIVEKEMYSFPDRGGRSITLRPEGTAPVARAYVEHRLAARPQPTKVYYMGPMFRYERPQAGRYRQFHQFGAEVLGAASPAADVEIIAMPIEVFRALGIEDVVVNLNSIGCPSCRPAYREVLRQAYAPVHDGLCPSCKSRYDRNPLRLLDCKSEECRALLPSPPPVFDHLCAECKDHFTQVRRLLDSVGVGCTLNSRLVRGLDYYTKTTFEYNMAGIGAQDALGGGGRYDGLVEECGGGPTPGVGVACGIERCVLAMKASASDDRYAQKLDVYIVALGERAREKAFSVAFELRGAGISADYDILGRGLKAQMRYADKLRARYVAIIGDDELDAGVATLKNMTGGEQERVGFDSLRDRLFQIMAPGRVC